jgi:hypothetical protein
VVGAVITKLRPAWIIRGAGFGQVGIVGASFHLARLHMETSG